MTMTISFSVPDEYPMIVLACVAVCFQCYFVAMAVVVPARKKLFNNQFMKDNFAKEHANAFPGQRAPLMGFPDIGAGRFSDALSYKDWFNFNNTMRAHMNIFEQLHVIIPFILVGGLFLPRFVLYAAWLGVVSRAFYVIGYIMKGPDARVFGAVLNLFPLYGIAIFSLYQLAKNTI